MYVCHDISPHIYRQPYEEVTFGLSRGMINLGILYNPPFYYFSFNIFFYGYICFSQMSHQFYNLSFLIVLRVSYVFLFI